VEDVLVCTPDILKMKSGGKYVECRFLNYIDKSGAGTAVAGIPLGS
jgi:hypothetical protein